jgi:hypothetical protein
MSYADAIALGDVVKDSVQDNDEAKELGADIVFNHHNMSEQEIMDTTYKLITIVAAFTASRIVGHLLPEDKLNEVVDAINDLDSLGEGDN